MAFPDHIVFVTRTLLRSIGRMGVRWHGVERGAVDFRVYVGSHP